MKLRKEKAVSVIVNGIERIATVVTKQPENSTKIGISSPWYNFYEVIENIGEDTHYWTYAVIK